MTKIKGNAADKAANINNGAIEHANDQLAKLAKDYVLKLDKQVGQLQLETVYKARDIVAEVPDADTTPVIKALPKQRKSEALTVIHTSDAVLEAAKAWFAKNRKPGLQTLARAIKLELFDGELADETAAKRFINTGKNDEWLAATGQTPEPVTPEPVQGSDEGEPAEPKDGRDTERKNPTESEVGNLKRLLDLQEQIAALLPAYEKEMAAYGPECKKAVKAHVKALKAAQTSAEVVNKAAANG